MKNTTLPKVNDLTMSKARKAHFVGIGGVGISAIARMMLLEGRKVSGSDISDSMIIDELRKLGATISLGHSADNITDDVDLIVYTPAITIDNPELKMAVKLDIPMLSYPETLGLISKNKYTIAISGTHGKTTTTAMIAKILIDAKKDPTVIVGSLLKDNKTPDLEASSGQGSNFVAGKSDYFVIEACEYKKSFLNLEPKIIVITNIDNDHLDYYGSLENIKKAFGEFASKLPKEGYLVCDPNDKNLKEIVEVEKYTIINYTEFIDEKLKLKIPGRHNILNSAAAMAVSHILRIDKKLTEKSLRNFLGTWRRFEFKGKTENGILVYDDYGHHPTEIKATLKGAREFFGDKEIWCVFQPHLYSRTKNHLVELSKSFDDADRVLVSPIYGAREKKSLGVSSQDLTEKIKENNKNALYFSNFSEIKDYIMANCGKNSVVITMGAGDIYKVSNDLIVSG